MIDEVPNKTIKIQVYGVPIDSTMMIINKLARNFLSLLVISILFLDKDIPVMYGILYLNYLVSFLG